MVFVDEHPQLVKMIELTPGDFMKARDWVYRIDPDAAVVPMLVDITTKADDAFTSSGTTYTALNVTTDWQAFHFEDAEQLRQYVDTSGSPTEQQRQADLLQAVFKFIVAAARGCAFLSRRDRTLFAYQVDFEPGPGHVLLDATADITGMTVLMDGMDHVEVPAVDFSNLDLVHVQQPKAFQYVSDVVKKASKARPYAEWIKKTVLDNTAPGDDVLVVAQKGLFDHEYLARAEDPAEPVDWEGRKVNTIWWGIGIGSNKYKNKTVVCLFSEFYVKRPKVIADVHGWTGTPVTAPKLKEASQSNATSGAYFTAFEGHLLRWTKQLACRGAVRNIDDQGRCGRMKLVTSMSKRRLLRSLEHMFPGVPKPEFKVDTKAGAGKTTKVDKLIKLLSEGDGDVYWSDEIAEKTGIPADQLSRTIKKSVPLRETMNTLGFAVVTAKELGLPGRRRGIASLETATA